METHVDKGGGHGEFVDLVRLEVLDQGAVQGLVAPELLDHVTPEELDLLIGEGPLLKDLGGPELVPPVYKGYRFDDPAQVMAFVHGGVAATHHHHVLTAEEVAVAHCAVGDAAAGKRVFTGHAQLVVGAAGGDDYSLGGKVPVIGMDGLDRLFDVLDTYHFGVLGLGPEACGLLVHPFGQFLALDAIGKAGVVLDFVGDQQLAAGAQLLQDHRLHHCPGGVETGSQARGSGPQNSYVVVCFHNRRNFSYSCFPGRLLDP